MDIKAIDPQLLAFFQQLDPAQQHNAQQVVQEAVKLGFAPELVRDVFEQFKDPAQRRRLLGQDDTKRVEKKAAAKSALAEDGDHYNGPELHIGDSLFDLSEALASPLGSREGVLEARFAHEPNINNLREQIAGLVQELNLAAQGARA
jgi:hypothetical protein